MEFYSQHTELLAPRLTSLLTDFTRQGALPDSMAEVIIVLVPKPGKDPLEYASYRPISLLNVDAKVLAKVLSVHLAGVISDIVHEDQTGFMPGKGTDIIIRRLFLNLSLTHDQTGSRVVASLDAKKAFDSVEWEYL